MWNMVKVYEKLELFGTFWFGVKTEDRNCQPMQVSMPGTTN